MAEPLLRRKKMLQVAGIVLGTYAAAMALTRLTYRSVLYPAPSTGLDSAPPGAGLRQFTASDGQPVQAAIYGANHRPTLVMFHGNGESIANTVSIGRALASRGVRFVAMEYRGYGSSPAAEGPTEIGLYADARGVLETLVAEGADRDAITVWGRSLGSGVAVEMIARGLAARLVLQAPFTSIPAVAQGFVRVLPMDWLMADKFDSLGKAARVEVPTLIMHGDEDAIVPYPMGVALADAIDGATLLTVPGAGHNDLFARDYDRLFSAILSWTLHGSL